MPIADDEVSLIGIGVAFAGFDGDVGLFGPVVVIGIEFPDGGASVEGLFVQEFARSCVEDEMISLMEPVDVFCVPM